MTFRMSGFRMNVRIQFFTTLVVLVLVSAAGCSGKRGEGDSCAKPEDCDTGLTCSPDLSAPLDPSSMKCLSPEALKKAFDDAMNNAGRAR